MPIVCERAGIVFLPGIGEETSCLKRDIYRIETGSEAAEEDIDAHPGYETCPLPRFWRPPPGLETLAFVKDPVHRLFDIWRFMVNPGRFDREGSLARLEAARLDPDPDFAAFVTRYRAYCRCSPALREACLPLKRFLGRGAARIDHAFDPADLPMARALLYARAGLAVPEAGDWTPPRHSPILGDRQVEALRRITGADYRWYGGSARIAASPILKAAILPDRIDPETLPAVTAPEAPPDPDLHLVALVREDPGLIRAFVAHYRRLGVGTLHLHFDDPDDPMADELAANPQVEVIRCDARFWGGEPPASIEARQKACYLRLYRRLTRGWLICCDGDELIYPGAPLPGLLAATAADQHFIRAEPGEAVWARDASTDGLFSATHIRLRLRPPRWPAVRDRLYGPEWRLFYRNMLSHVSGKYILRCGVQIREINLHNVVFETATDRSFGRFEGGTQVMLVHHDAPNFELWRRKLGRRLADGHGFFAQGHHRRDQIEAFATARAAGKERALFETLYRLDDDALRLLGACDVIRRIAPYGGGQADGGDGAGARRG